MLVGRDGDEGGGGAKLASCSSRGVLSTFISVRSPRELEQVALAVIPPTPPHTPPHTFNPLTHLPIIVFLRASDTHRFIALHE